MASSRQKIRCQFCGYFGKGWKKGGDQCPKCGRMYSWLAAQDEEDEP